MNRVTNIVWRTASGARLGGFAYRYDVLGRIVSRSHDLDRLSSDGGVTYTYDAAGKHQLRQQSPRHPFGILQEGNGGKD